MRKQLLRGQSYMYKIHLLGFFFLNLFKMKALWKICFDRISMYQSVCCVISMCNFLILF